MKNKLSGKGLKKKKKKQQEKKLWNIQEYTLTSLLVSPGQHNDGNNNERNQYERCQEVAQMLHEITLEEDIFHIVIR